MEMFRPEINHMNYEIGQRMSGDLWTLTLIEVFRDGGALGVESSQKTTTVTPRLNLQVWS